MKRMLLLLLIVVPISIIAQHKQNKRSMEKFETWERAKTIELLDLDEETAVRFFARKNEHQKKMKEIMGQRFSLLEKLEKEIKESGGSDKYFGDQMDNLLSIEQKISKEREIYFKSLTDILSKAQIVKLLVFDNKFKRELREAIMERPRRENDKN
ncbi:MAG: hypothetical protein KF816_06110 [Melioribacteraceae bacterium]|nr:hypothetical protein [Melioribacteraceae bacterium]